jgi:predicted dehydrogenase
LSLAKRRWQSLRVATAQRKIRVAVIGTGSLGQHHARLYAQMATAGSVEFTGVYDANPEAAKLHAAKHSVGAFGSVAEAAVSADALSVVTPTATHFPIAKQLIEAGKHVLVEKPMTSTTAEASELVALAHKQNCLLQVGHVERFNPVYTYLERVATNPRFIESHRLSPFPARSTDIGVVLDLMIHDLDIVLALVKSPVANVDAVGIPVLSRSEDVANARLRFENGCIADLTVSRVSAERRRTIHVFSGGDDASYISLNYQAQEGFIYRVAPGGDNESSLPQKLPHAGDAIVVNQFGGKRVVREPVPITKDEPLKLELEHFVDCVRREQKPLVDGASAQRALELAFQITEQIQHAARREMAVPR